MVAILRNAVCVFLSLLLLLLLPFWNSTTPHPLLLYAFAENGPLFPLPIDDSPGHKPNPDRYLPDNAGYEDSSIRVKIETVRAYETTILVARIQLVHPSQIRTAMASSYGDTTRATGAFIANRMNAVLAINGDFYDFDNKGYLVRQGVKYRKRMKANSDMLIIDDLGDLHILENVRFDDITAFERPIVNTFNFGPGLVVNGALGNRLARNGIGANKPTLRMGIGQTGPLSYVCVATEGPRNRGSRGLTIKEFADFMFSLGCEQAYNLDGGSSSTMVLDNKKINALSYGKARYISDIIYFASLETTGKADDANEAMPRPGKCPQSSSRN